MKRMFINKIKVMLEDERSTIIARSKQNLNIDLDLEGDEIDAVQANILALATSQLAIRDRDKLSKIDNAMKKISEGTFGVCEECGEGISEKRLLINPGFITCIGCAEYLELLEKKNRR